MSDTPPPTYRRGLRGFEPANPAAEQFWRETKIGGLVRLDGKRPRNLARHNLYWALCTIAADNMDEYPTPKRLHLATKIALGIGEPVPPLKNGGKWGFEPGSTAFANMPEHEFREFLDKALDLWAARLGVPVSVLMDEARAQDRRAA